MLGELPDLPYLPELPARGPGADMIGRSAALLGRAAGGAVRRPLAAHRPARAATCAGPGTCWNATSTRCTEQAAEYAGTFKIQVAGPWTLAAALELPLGGRAAARPRRRPRAGRVARRRRPRCTWPTSPPGCRARRLLLQVDEPSLPAVLAGRVPHGERALHVPRGRGVDGAGGAAPIVVAAAGVPVVVHCCAPDVPLELLREAGAAARRDRPALVHRPRPARRGDRRGDGARGGRCRSAAAGAVVGRGGAAGPGRVAQARVPARPTPRRAVAVSPTCGLAGVSPSAARSLLAACPRRRPPPGRRRPPEPAGPCGAMASGVSFLAMSTSYLDVDGGRIAYEWPATGRWWCACRAWATCGRSSGTPCRPSLPPATASPRWTCAATATATRRSPPTATGRPVATCSR